MAEPEAGSPHQRLKVVIGQSMLVDSVQPIDRVSVTEPKMVDAIVISPQQILLNGKSPGLTTFILWDKAGGYTFYDIAVQRDVSLLIEKLHEIDKNIRIEIQAANDSVILWGKVANAAVITKAVTVASAFFGGGGLKITAGPGGTVLKEDQLPMRATTTGAFTEAGKNVARSWNVGEGAIITTDNGKVISFLEVAESQQVELQVRIAEVNRTALKELGINLRSKLSGFSFATIPMGLPPGLSKSPTGIIDSHDALIQALEEKGLATVLAEPNLTAISGQQASFLAGGEFPYLEANDTQSGRSFSVRFRNFGVRLDFTPEVKESGIINLKVSPEVSALDRENSVIIFDTEVPPLKIRRAETTVEIKEGDSLIIGGLISRELTRQLSQVPWIGDIPYIGALFRSTRFINNETELIIMITPRMVKPLTPEQIPALSKVLTELPSDYELFIMGHLEGNNEMVGPFGHSR
ncbi:MAG TPA: type II and III secretion system protein family protein [Candidatus Brocadiales bacterium]|nr:type II and III secretion system protein family protein [Candidatus Brocadiales bacterium]